MVCLAVLLDATSDGLSQLLWVQCGRWGGCTLLLASRRPGVVDCEDGNVVGGCCPALKMPTMASLWMPTW